MATENSKDFSFALHSTYYLYRPIWPVCLLSVFLTCCPTGVLGRPVLQFPLPVDWKRPGGTAGGGNLLSTVLHCSVRLTVVLST